MPPLAGTLAALVATCLDLTAQGLPDAAWVINAHAYEVKSVAFSGNGAVVGSCSLDRTVKVWNATNGQLVRAFSISSGGPLSVALSPDGAYLAAGDGDGGTRLWRVADGVRLWSLQANGQQVNALAFSPNGVYLAAGLSGSRLLFADAFLQFGDYLDGQEGDVAAVAFSPDNRLLASAATDSTVRLWRVPDGTLWRTLQHSNAVHSVDFTPDGSLLATASADGLARVWRVADGEVVRILEGGGGNAIRFSADGRLLLTVNSGTIKFWRAADGRLLHSFTNANAGPLAVASNGKYFAYGRNDGAVVLARMPVLLAGSRAVTNRFQMEWQGGTGLYQLQQTSNVASPVWQNVGVPTTNTSTNVPLTATNAFFRIQSLTNAP